MTNHSHDTSSRNGTNADAGKSAVGGILGGLGEVLGKFADLAETAERLQKSGNFKTPDGREGRYQMGLNIRTLADAAGNERVTVEPFGDVTRDDQGHAKVSEVREPPTDIFNEEAHVLVIVEMPGVGDDDATFTAEGDVLTIEARTGEKRFHKELLLPTACDAERLNVTGRNGVFEITLPHA
ncbi:MAG: Hsp20/alpha crystallin family protein [Planctomycetota bacterium]